MPTVQLLIKGRVQGVFYRASAKDIAKDLGVTGWIRNTPDDHVEAMISGTQQQLDTFITWCRRGPRRAVVADVIVTPKEDLDFDGFKIEQ